MVRDDQIAAILDCTFHRFLAHIECDEDLPHFIVW